MALVEHTERAFANVGIVRMSVEPCPGESAVPRPVVFSISSGMNSDISAAGLDVALEIILLGGVEHVAGCVQENDCAVPREILRGECAGVFSRVDREPILLSELSNRRYPDT